MAFLLLSAFGAGLSATANESFADSGYYYYNNECFLQNIAIAGSAQLSASVSEAGTRGVNPPQHAYLTSSQQSTYDDGIFFVNGVSPTIPTRQDVETHTNSKSDARYFAGTGFQNAFAMSMAPKKDIYDKMAFVTGWAPNGGPYKVFSDTVSVEGLAATIGSGP